MARPGEFQVGQLYLGPNRYGLPVWSQPDGVGGLVYPQQTQGQKSALYSFGCGHWLNCVEVYSYGDPYEGEEVMALICCPACSFIQQIMPWSQYINYMDTPLVVA